MTTSLSSEQILALAPDPGSAKAGQGLAGKHKWQTLGRDARAAWGECQGSAKEPYRTQVDLAGPAFRCSCPSRKFPCKHGLGLLLLLAREPASFAQAVPPAWVAEWLVKREQSAQRQAQPVRADAAPDMAAQARRAAARDARVAAGVDELRRWLRDLLRHGLADAPQRPTSFWEGMAKRMVDAQAPGLARQLRELGSLAAAGGNWQARLLDGLARLHLLLESFQRIEQLDAALQADLRAALGWAQQKDDLPADGALRDQWLVLGQRTEEDENLRTQRTWLWGIASGRLALSLSFAMFSQPLDRSLPPGTLLDAELGFFLSSYPLRAVVRERYGPPQPCAGMPGAPGCMAASAGYAEALARLPWIERFPMALAAVTPAPYGPGWHVYDKAGHTLPLDLHFEAGWRLLALSGGRPLTLFGEWNGTTLLPLSAWAEGEFYAFYSEVQKY